jgi:hypothetical protein
MESTLALRIENRVSRGRVEWEISVESVSENVP